MITVLLEPGRSGLSRGGAVAAASLLGFTLCASVLAGAASPGAGLGVIAMGLLAATIADFALWRDMMEQDARTLDAEAAQEQFALPPPMPETVVVQPVKEAVPA